METPKVNWYIIGGIAIVGYLAYRYFSTNDTTSSQQTPNATVGGVGGSGSSGSGGGGDTYNYYGQPTENTTTQTTQPDPTQNTLSTGGLFSTGNTSQDYTLSYLLPLTIQTKRETQTVNNANTIIVSSGANGTQRFTPYDSKMTLSNALSTLGSTINTSAGSQTLDKNSAVTISQSQTSSQTFIPYSNPKSNSLGNSFWSNIATNTLNSNPYTSTLLSVTKAVVPTKK